MITTIWNPTSSRRRGRENRTAPRPAMSHYLNGWPVSLMHGAAALLLALPLVASWLFAAGPPGSAEPKKPSGGTPAVGDSSPDVAAAFQELRASKSPESLPNVIAVRKQQAADERCVTIRQANLLHRHFLEEVYEPFQSWESVGREPELPGTHLRYKGMLRRTCEGGLRLADDVGDPLEWMFERLGEGVFTITVTTVKTKLTLAKCSIEGQDFYANVLWVFHGHTVDDRLPELGGHSVREVLARIEAPLRKPGAPSPYSPPGI